MIKLCAIKSNFSFKKQNISIRKEKHCEQYVGAEMRHIPSIANGD